MFNNELFSANLKSLRKKQQLSMESLGEKLNVTKQTVSRWESSDRLPSLNIASEIADFFDVSLDYLVGRTDDPKRY